MLQQLLSRCYLHNIIEYIFFVLIAMAYVQEVEQKAELHSAVHITTLAADDVVHLVAQAIVTDPDAFFKLGAAETLEDLTFTEFMQACE